MMLPPEPHMTGILLVVLGVLLAVSAAVSRASRFGIPAVLIFLGIGMLAGSEGIGRIHFEDYHLSFRLGVVALALILFDGGLNTPAAVARRVAGPAGVLATLGVLGTAGFVGLCGRALGLPWGEALLFGAMVSSTDAAAVFSVLRSGRVHLPERLGATLEAESGLNDPMAVVLTLLLTEVVLVGRPPGPGALLAVPAQLLIGAAAGLAIGAAGRWALLRLKLTVGGLYPVLTLAFAFISFGLPTLLGGSGFLAVYLAGMILGNGPLPYRTAVLRVHDAVAWLSQIVMFLALGLLVFPSRVWAVAGMGIPLALLLVFVARPLIVWLLLLPFHYPLREVAYLGWAGLRGAVPIILGTYPVLAGVGSGERIFNLVFFVVVASVLLQGGSLRWVARRLGLAQQELPVPNAVLEITSMRPLRGEVMSFHITGEAAVAGVALGEIPFPPEAGAVLAVRGDALLAPRDDVVLEPGDHVYVFCQRGDRAEIQLLFGQRPEE
jgi:cell volume regulation protein A